MAILWWIAVTALATWVLMRTRAGNWIFAVGGSAQAARAVGVPGGRTKIALFMTTAVAAWLVGSILALRFTSVQANAGIGQEFIYIIAAVIGGCLLTGGYGSAVGAAIGAVIFGMARQGHRLRRLGRDWFKFFLGAMLLLATLVNRLRRRRAEVDGGDGGARPARGLGKTFGNVIALRDVSIRGARGRGHLRARRQRRRQVHADQDPLRRAPARRGRRSSSTASRCRLRPARATRWTAASPRSTRTWRWSR